jgi:hypothetical protein
METHYKPRTIQVERKLFCRSHEAAKSFREAIEIMWFFRSARRMIAATRAGRAAYQPKDHA